MLRKINCLMIIAVLLMCVTTSYAAGRIETPQRAMDKYYDVVREAAPNLPGWTVYRPANLTSGIKGRLPVLIWSNGACTETNDGAFYFLSQIAAHGFVVVAFGEPDAHVGGSNKAEEARMKSAIDWATTPPGRGGPAYFNQLDASKIAAAGCSCGGVDAEYAAVTDPRVKTSIIMGSGFYPNLKPGDACRMSGCNGHSRDLLGNLYGPIMFLPGQEGKDIAWPNASENYPLINHVPVVLAYKDGAGHCGYIGSANTALQLEAIQAVVNWLDGILNKNQEALNWVIRPDGLDSIQGWTIWQKGF